MPYKINSIISPSHLLRAKTTQTKASVTLRHNNTNNNTDNTTDNTKNNTDIITNNNNTTSAVCGLDKDFVLLVSLEEVHRPRMWVEKDNNHQAAMLAFYPNFEYPTRGVRGARTMR